MAKTAVPGKAGDLGGVPFEEAHGCFVVRKGGEEEGGEEEEEEAVCQIQKGKLNRLGWTAEREQEGGSSVQNQQQQLR